MVTRYFVVNVHLFRYGNDGQSISSGNVYLQPAAAQHFAMVLRAGFFFDRLVNTPLRNAREVIIAYATDAKRANEQQNVGNPYCAVHGFVVTTGTVSAYDIRDYTEKVLASGQGSITTTTTVHVAECSTPEEFYIKVHNVPAAHILVHFDYDAVVD